MSTVLVIIPHTVEPALNGFEEVQSVKCKQQIVLILLKSERHFDVISFKELFEKVPPDSILSYLYETGLFYCL